MLSNIEERGGGGGPVFLLEEYQRLVEGLREAHINRETDVILASPGNIVKHRGRGPVFLSEEYQRLVEGLREAHINRETDVILANPGTVNPVLSGHSKRRPKLVFKTNYRLMQVKSIAECSRGTIQQYFRPSLSYHLSLTPLFCLLLSGLLRQVLL